MGSWPLGPGDKTGCFCPVATLLGILSQNISNRYRLLGGSLGLFEKIPITKSFCSNRHGRYNAIPLEQWSSSFSEKLFTKVSFSSLLPSNLCRLSIVINSSRFPERFKFRAPRVCAGGWLSGAMGLILALANHAGHRINDKCRQALTKFHELLHKTFRAMDIASTPLSGHCNEVISHSKTLMKSDPEIL